MSRSSLSKLIKFFLLLSILPLLLVAIKTIVDLRKGASFQPANITIDAQPTKNNINSAFWQNLAQGGEETDNMILPVLESARALSPKVIRIDHVFDYYGVYLSPGQYDFSRLDTIVNSILYTGATPMFSLSYIPDNMAKDTSGQPQNWSDWNDLITATARHYSVDKKIDGVFYEVYNEPDLFGGWHYAKSPNYTTLFINTSTAISTGAGTSTYFIGGPATTDLYSNWIESLLKTAQANSLKLDFLSFHHYSPTINSFLTHAATIKNILSKYPRFRHLSIFITESGPTSQLDPIYTSPISAYHLLSLITQTYTSFDKIFTFELVDGPNHNGWGILPHPSATNQSPRPRYQALQFLNQLSGQQLTVSGNGSFVSALASRQADTIQILLVNYDPAANHHETTPLIIRNIDPGTYTLTTTDFSGQSYQKTISTTFAYRDQVYLPPNTAQILEFKKL